MSLTLKKNIVLGVTGGIAAYKAAELARLLIKAGAELRVVMTPAACEFVTPLTFHALSGHRVYSDIFEAEADSAMAHIELARWADLMIIAPASADFIAKLRQGFADNMLLTLCLASKQPVAIAPAMNRQMYANPATRSNLDELISRETIVWGPDAGEQACGDVGLGRMLEAGHLMEMIEAHFRPGKLDGRHVLITAGPTRETIDPVRYISNHSSGKMGYALAQAAEQAGARVTLVSGPVNLATPSGIKRIDVVSAVDMRDAVIDVVVDADIFIACAAVADYQVEQPASQKMKKSSHPLKISLLPNPDILSEVTALENPPFTLGFAAETENLESHARDKLQRKKLDMIAANQVGQDSGGFNSNRNEVLLLWSNGKQRLPMSDKKRIAQQIIDRISDQYSFINQ